MKAIILAGGFGTRMKEKLKDVPKPMAPVLGKPFLEHQICYLREQGITDIILAVYNMADKIKSYFGNGSRWLVDLTYSEEEMPLGTAGAIKKAQKYIDDTFLVLNGDTYADIDLQKMLEFHNAKKSNFTMALTKNSDPIHFGSVVMDGNKIIGFAEKANSSNELINAGVYLFEPKLFDYIAPDRNSSIEKDLFPILAKEGSLYGYKFDGYFMDIGRPETYEQFKEDALSSLFIRKENTVSESLTKINKSGLNLLLVVDEQKRLLGTITDKIIHRFLTSDGHLEDKVEKTMVTDIVTAKTSDDEEQINQKFLLSGVQRLPVLDDSGVIRRLEFRAEKIRMENFPILRGKSPLRISFAGGGTDLPYFFEKYGGIVISATIDKYCHATIIKRADSKIIINSDLADEIVLDSRKDIRYDGKFDLVKAIVNLMKPEFGFELYLYNDIPPGRGLGSSASLSVLLVSMLSELQSLHYDDYKIAELAYKAERDELKIKGGWQDQYAAVTGGFNFMEFNKDKNLIYPLRLKSDTIHEFNEHLMLCYVGDSHFSGSLHQNQERNFAEKEEDLVKSLNDLKLLAIEIKDHLLTHEIEGIGELLHESWESKKRLNQGISNPKIDSLYTIGLKNGAIGGRLLGAGGGGYILFFHAPKKRNILKKALEKEGGEIINFNFESAGTLIRSVKNKG